MQDRFRLLALDLDGTLMDADGKIGSRVKERLDDLARDGVVLTIATGRLFASARPFANEIGITCPIIASSGAVIRYPDSGELIYSRPVEPQVVERVLLQTAEQPVTRYLVVGDDLVTDSPQDPASLRYAEILGVSLRPSDELRSLLYDGEDVLALLIRGEPGHMSGLERKYQRDLSGQARAFRSFPHLLEILDPGASKGNALVYLTERLGMVPSQTVAVGDGPGDLDMLEAAGAGALVANAPPGLERSGDYRAREAYGNGVVEVIDRYFGKAASP